jgi:hypothetical protein
MAKFRDIAWAVAGLLVAALAGESAYTVHVMRPKGIETMQTVQETADKVHTYVIYQLDEFQSEPYQKRLKQSLEFGRDASITIAKLNRTTIPEMTAAFRYLREHNLASFDTLTLSLNEFVARDMSGLVKNLDVKMNQGILPGLAATLDALNLSVSDLDDRIIKESGLTLRQFNALLSDDRVNQFLTNLVTMSANGARATDELAASMGAVEAMLKDKLPQIFDLWIKAMKATNRFQKWIYFARILSYLGPLVPWQ